VLPKSNSGGKAAGISAPRRRRLSAEEYIEGVLRGDRIILARAITLIESSLPADAELAARVLEGVLPHTGDSRRVGITGVPGVGKSTFIDTLGLHLIRDYGEKVAVLSVDPSSPVSGGSILGDKTRMERLSLEEKAFIRPSPSRGHLGGVTLHTREAILLCEAAGYKNILVETVGVGQSEVAARSMTDFFLLLMLPGAGDELQGIKRGIIEMIDGMAINKADGDNKARAKRAKAEYSRALRLLPAGPDRWRPPVMTCSALTGEGIPELWKMVLAHQEHRKASGHFEERRSQQSLAWMHELIATGLENLFRSDPAVAARIPALEESVRTGKVSSFAAAQQLLSLFRKKEQ